jgi:hypothetical protein
MFIRRAEANWWVFHFGTFVPGNNRSLEKLRNLNEGTNDNVPDDNVPDDEANMDNAVNGPTVLAHVELARTVCKYIASTPRL